MVVGYQEIAAAAGVSPAAARQAACRGLFDVDDLASTARWIALHQPDVVTRAELDEAVERAAPL